MNFKTWAVGLVGVLSAIVLVTHATPTPNFMGSQSINLWRLQQASKSTVSGPRLAVQDPSKFGSGRYSEFPPHYFDQPLDHFNKGSETFGQRYWISTRHYTPGAGQPVYVLDGGETSGEDRLPFLDTG